MAETNKERLGTVEESLAKISESISQMGAVIAQLGTRMEAIEKATGKSAGQPPSEVLRAKVKPFTNFGPVALDGNGQPLTEVDRKLMNGEPVYDVRNGTSGQAILDTLQINKIGV